MQNLALNFYVPIATNMQLGVSSSYSDLYRNDENAVYPYNIGNVINITGSSARQPGYYYFYYNIEVEVPCINTTNIIETDFIDNRKIIKKIDLLGRNVANGNFQQPIFYIYDNGTVEKKIIID